MGFKPPRKVYRLLFADEDMAGLEVRARSMRLGQMMELLDLMELADRPLTAEDKPKVHQLFATFAKALVSWNVEDDEEDGGQPVPATLDGLYSQEQGFVIAIIKAWTEAVAAVPPPLPQPSSGGVPSALEASIPMAPLSPSPVS